MDEFKVTIDQFDGPLDLMLHLISEKQLDLLDLDMNALTDQYMAYIEGMQELHLDVASEYLAELVKLIEYKSKKMLGLKQEEPTEEEYTKEKLVSRLLEYQKYKEASAQLNEMYEDRQLLISKPMSLEADQWMKESEDQPVTGSPYDLMKAMKKVLYRIQIQTPSIASYEVKEISIEDRELEVRARLSSLPETFTFERLLDDCTGSMQKAIATFISVLDLIRQHLLFFTIDEEEEIWLTRGDGNE